MSLADRFQEAGSFSGRLRVHRIGSWRNLIRSMAILTITSFVILSCAAPSEAQLQYPDLSYYQGAPGYFDADYKDGLKYYARVSKRAYRFGNRRFLDSICYWTMMAECHYHMGNYSQAVEFYEQSLQLYLTHQNENWQSRITPPMAIQQDNAALQRAQVTWGVPTRKGSVARIPDVFQVIFGQMANERVLQQGGVVQNPEIKKVDVSEIMRCVALCLHRRRVIKGPTAKLDPLTAQLVTGLSMTNAGDGSVMGSYNGVVLGIAMAATEDWEAAAAILKRSVQLSGGLDHPLTPLALMESAHVAQAAGSDTVASVLAMEASYSAAIFSQYDLVEEALSLGTMLHLKSNRTPFPPLAFAIEWARRNRARMMQASMIVRLAECYSEAGDPATSAKILSQAGQAIRARTTLDGAVVSARLKYVTALNGFLQGNFNRGMSSLNAALKHFQNAGSLWVYRLTLADSLLAAGTINARQADQLYSVLLHDPTEEDWLTDPIESIAFLATPHVGAMERWFEIVVQRRDYKRALEIGEQIRRHRFFASLPLGGRLMGFRWGTEAPELAVTKSARGIRAKFLNENPIYLRASQQATQLQQELDALPLQPDPDSDEAKKQADLVKKLSVIASTQEAILASNALRRLPSELAFPPSHPVAELRTGFRDDQVALVTVATFNGYHWFLANKKAVKYVGFSSVRDVHRGVAKWLNELGVSEASVDVNKLAEEDWKVSAKTLANQFFPDSKPADWEPVQELLIIPDGALWYLPFEALLIGEDAEQKFLSEFVDIRYAPTFALGVGAQREVNEGQKTAVVVSRLHIRGDEALAVGAFDELKKTMPEASKFESIRTSTNTFGGLVDTLVVWSEIKPTKGRPMNLAPMQMGSAKYDGTLGDWMSLPWRGPEQIIMPAYQADGITMRSKSFGGEMFLTTMAMMASGSRSILISRWNTAGKTSIDLTRQYLEKQKEDGVAKALADSRAAVRESTLDPENEPRLRSKSSDPETKAAHPIFWAGHMRLEIPDESALKLVAKVDPKNSEKDEGKDGGKEGDDAGKMPEEDKGKMPGDPAKLPGGEGDKVAPRTFGAGVPAKPDAKKGGGEKTDTDKQQDKKTVTEPGKGTETTGGDKPEAGTKKPSGVGWQPRPAAKPKTNEGGGI
ncbi:MAG: CHAT domain-containing protein [Planctomycetota bacterium]